MSEPEASVLPPKSLQTPAQERGDVHDNLGTHTQASPAVSSESANSQESGAQNAASGATLVGDSQSLVLGIAVVDFNHLVGPQVEYSYPSDFIHNEDLCRKLPFLALPDGSHLKDEDFCYFHFDCPSLHPKTLFGIACNRQITSDQLINKGAHVTRSAVQKAVVVLATRAIFGTVREKLGIVTRAYFAQRDLGDLAILRDFFDTLETSVSGHDDQALYMATAVRAFVHDWRFKTLVLLKLMLLQRRVRVWLTDNVLWVPRRIPVYNTVQSCVAFPGTPWCTPGCSTPRDVVAAARKGGVAAYV